MVVLDENRLMGTSEDQLDHLKRMILRDRDHPSVILWSIGNEEWGIEGNEKGARIAATMQAVAKHLDPTVLSPLPSAEAGAGGISSVIDVMGYNYITGKSTDNRHAQFPNQPGIGTEETTTQGTRGVYFDDRPNAHMAPLEYGDSGGNCEIGWKPTPPDHTLPDCFIGPDSITAARKPPLVIRPSSASMAFSTPVAFPKTAFII